MRELTDNELIALGLREHAQTCDEVAAKYRHDSDHRQGWKLRADRCRDLAARYEAAAQIEKPRNLA